uniref:BspA family leucine-rich repeat surface protein n=1 Tax=Muricauda brasiliensis TaxID=2162892 RepID=UPI00131EF3D3
MKSTLKLILLTMCCLCFSSAMAQSEFITIWKTDNPGITDVNSIEIPTGNGTFAYMVDWGDGSTDNMVYTGNATHTYSSPGTYTVSISGDFPHLRSPDTGDNEKLLSVEQWGDQVWESMSFSFYNCSNMVLNATDVPNLSQVTEMNGMFMGATSFNGNIGNWDVSNVTNMETMFNRASSFNQDIGNWDVSKVTKMTLMFYGATVFDQYIGNWDVSNVTGMALMFGDARVFNQNIGGWDVSNVTSMNSMFYNAFAFNQDIGSWNVANVTNMSGMFNRAISFNQDIGGWNVGNVENMYNMFSTASDFDQDISGWDVSKVTNMGVMFFQAREFNQNISLWNVGQVTNMAAMFSSASSFDQDLGSWNIANVQSVSNMFDGSQLSTDNYDKLLEGWSTLNLQNTLDLHAGASTYCNAAAARQKIIDDFGWTITDAGEDCPQRPFVTTWKTDNPGKTGPNSIEIPIGNGTFSYTVDWGDGSTDNTIYTGNATHNYATPGTYIVSISGDFPHLYFYTGYGSSSDSEKLLSVDQWGDQAWGSMSHSFYKCSNVVLKATDIPDLSQVSDMSYMFVNASSFNGDISSWDVSNVTDMQNLFSGASTFNQDISGWDVGNVTIMRYMFSNASAFNADISSWDVSNVTNMVGMFEDASVFNQGIGGWNVSNVTTMQGMFARASAFNGDIGGWNVSNVTDTRYLFYNATSFNQDIGGWDVSNVTDMFLMFSGASAFDQNLGNWQVGNVTEMAYMFQNATSFNQDIGGWDVSNVTYMYDMFKDTGLTTDNYDKLLEGWSTLTLQNGVYFNAGSSTYCIGAAARQKLIDDFGWIITDAGEDCPRPFITTWKTDNYGASEDDQITIPTGDGTFAYTVDWGDGSMDTTVYTGDATHIYATPGIYTVSISGDFPHMKFDGQEEDSRKLLSVEQWGDQTWGSMEQMFMYCLNLSVNASDVPDLSEVGSMRQMFYNASNNFNQDIGTWDVSNVSDMSGMFYHAEQFNQDIGGW